MPDDMPHPGSPPLVPEGAAPPPPEAPAGLPFPVVGVGASAGGLEALTGLLGGMPADPGLAVLVVMHLDPHSKSELAEVLSRVTRLPICEVAEGTAVEVNCLYVIPPAVTMGVEGGRLRLRPRPARGPNMPIDHLFRALAEEQKSRAIGVLLSGEGTDGTLGFQAIKAMGGITFAQDERSARHHSMPRTPVVEGYTDHVLPPDQIARELLRIARHPYSGPAPGVTGPFDDSEAVERVLALVRASSDVDFTHYKRTTIRRRIGRRMALRGVESLADYHALLRGNPAELHALHHDFLIRVTQFFRDPETFAALAERAFPALVQGRAPGSPIRIWVAGCSTGEEVYSLAISLLEFLGEREETFPVKILATDLSEAALEKARAGVYVDNIELDVSPERLRRFFLRANSHYQISKAVRELCVFSRHNLAGDPPFSRLDLVSCRNVLIYMDTQLQRRVMPILHYALVPGGLLVLGSSESVGPFTELFTAVDPRHRLFSKKAASPPPPVDFTYRAGGGAGERPAREDLAPPVWSALDVQRDPDRIVLGRYAPVGVVIDEAMTVVQFRGRTAPYLEPAPGMASLDLLRMLREGLLAEVRGAISRARAENVEVVREGLRMTEPSAPRAVKVEVIPFRVPASGARFFLVLFGDARGAAPAAVAPPAPEGEVEVSPEQQVSQLQQELAALREYLQSVIEEQESTNEELKSANEEILSANEELQSTNEELQTAKEEAQSANEELVTVNEELRQRNAELGRANNDLLNLLGGVNIPIVMVNRDLRIRRFTPLAEKVFNLIPTDAGRPISDIKTNLRVADLVGLLTGVIDTLTPHESEVQDSDGHWYSLRIRPYVTTESKIDGASIALLDIDAVKRALEQMRQAQAAPGRPGQ